MEHDARYGVHHGGESRQRQNISCDFDGALSCRLFDFLNTLGMRHRANVPNAIQNVARVGNQKRRQLAIIGPGARDGSFVNGPRCFVEEKRNRRDVGLGPVEAHVTLALLLGVVEGMSMKKGPDELAANVLDAKLEVRVLIYRVMPAIESGCADVEALLVGDFVASNQAGRVASSGGGNRRIEGMRKGISERDAWGCGLDSIRRRRTFEHARLGSHVEKSFYTHGEGRTKGRKENGPVVDRPASRVSVKMGYYFLPAAAGTLAYFF